MLVLYQGAALLSLFTIFVLVNWILRPFVPDDMARFVFTGLVSGWLVIGGLLFLEDPSRVQKVVWVIGEKFLSRNPWSSYLTRKERVGCYLDFWYDEEG